MSVTYSAPVILESTPNANDSFIVVRDFSVTWQRSGKASLRFTVKKGLTTDLASIPRVFRALIPQVGRHIQPAITHDWCYKNRQPQLSRAEADLLFLEGMAAVGVSWLRRRIMYLAVRLGGTGHWG